MHIHYNKWANGENYVNWRNENNNYSIYSRHKSDEFTVVNSLAPVIDMSCKGNDERLELMKDSVEWWCKAAKIMIDGDFYPLTKCNKDAKDFYAMQFEDAENRVGFIQIISNVDNPCENGEFYPVLKEDRDYTFTHYKNGKQKRIEANSSNKSFKTALKKANAEIWFYEY